MREVLIMRPTGKHEWGCFEFWDQFDVQKQNSSGRENLLKAHKKSCDFSTDYISGRCEALECMSVNARLAVVSSMR